MGENEGWAEPGGPLPNGLLPGAGSTMRSLDEDRWLKAEERIAELIACIQPNQLSEERRNAVADYVQRLIMKCFPCQVCTFGSVPLKTYLPDGDIDLTTFSHNQNSKDAWANQVRDMLESEEKNENAEFHVKEVQYIQAEVKLIKCLVENIVVDISFNQIGGLCTLCFLDEVDSLINQNHLFKRSIILIKAWCYYESRILGAHHGLISTYALETLVLYIFHVFNNSFHGPLEVLYRFLEFFSNFDWDNFCVSLWGPVPISSLPDVTAEPPRKDSGELLLSKLFLEACSSVYAVFPGGPENNGQPFVSKHFNVIDPLRVNNNLGRSVSKGNFFRIRSAFAFGAKRLARLLDCPKENLMFEVNQFFMNTWDRHGSGHRPDAPGIDSYRFKLSSSTPDTSHESGSPNNNKSITKKSKDPKSRDRPTTSELSEASRANGLKSQLTVNEQIQKDLKLDHSANDVQGRFLFARTRSSPELTDNYIHKASRGPTLKSPDRDSGLLDGSSDEFLAFSSSGAQQMMNQEEQDIVNMMASASLGQQVHAPFNLAPGHHLPYSIPPSFLASMGYTQRNFPGFIPTNIPFMDPSFSHVQFPHGLVSPQLTHYFPGVSPNNNPSEDSVDRSNENFGTVEINSLDADNDFWKEQDVSYDLENGNFDTCRSVDKPGSKYIPAPKHPKEKRGAVRENNSLRSRTSSESSWDGSSVKISKSTKDKRGKKIISTDLTAGKGKILSEHASNDTDDDDQEWGPSVVHGSEPVVQTSGSSDSMIPFGPMLINPGSRQRTNDNSGLIAFYPTGPPIPFLTMLPVYNYPHETGTSDETLDETKGHDSSGDLSSSGFLRGIMSTGEQSEEQQKLDILNSDFSSHWQNLQFGRFCQNSRNQWPMMYPSPVMVPPAYVQGRSQYDNPSRPLSTNTNLYSQLVTSYGHRMVPVAAPLQPVSGRHPNIYQSYVDDMPRYRGTGTYLPNPKSSVRDRHSSGSRRGNYNHDRNDNSFGDREGNWNANPKSRASSRNHNRSQSDKISSRNDRFTHTEGRSDRSWNSSYRHNTSVPNYQSQNGPLRSNNSSQNGPQDMGYSMYPLGGMNPNGVSSGPSGSPVMMLYPFDHNDNIYGSQSEQVEFGSLGQVGFVGTNEQSQLNDGNQARALEDHRLHGGSGHLSSPEQPSSPRHQRRMVAPIKAEEVKNNLGKGVDSDSSLIEVLSDNLDRTNKVKSGAEKLVAANSNKFAKYPG
ncbi:hypothetical protein PHJA_001335900 [Phtheirospermum japonicum]|uniref:Polymerase nucleotidyl transferase domain-containing protein n=1 Tax=Phtheirospermum japonicum TaxID=374723 RepID=A0A830C453_9LAMI|nr:hypothetical protein PHJA_001335900 [Phtheirospermum japonicum]